MMRFRLLGPVEVRVGEDWRGIGAPKWRSVLAALLIHPGQIVSADTLISELWREDPPARAPNLVSIYVLRLRRLMDDPDGHLLVTRAPGYQLRVAGDDTDALLFEAMVRDGRRAFAAGDLAGAASRLTEALALWYGRPLDDVPPTPLVEAEAERLAELRLGAVELRITAELTLGGHDQAVAELRRLLADHPLREGLWLLLMRALDGAGRHAEALEVYARARDAISEQLGVDPGAELRQLHAQLLAKDTAAAPAGAVFIPGGRPPRGPPALGGAARPPNPAGLRPGRGATRGAQGPAQLPADVADFTGRDEQVKRLSDLLSGTGASGDPGAVRIAVVAGAGGLGKTSLAVHAAHRVRRRFPDGQLYVDLLGATPAALPPGDVLARFLRDLGVDGKDIPVNEDERAAWYRTALARRRMLVVLDNARDAAQVRPLLPGSASSAVLVTTRNRMPDLASTKLVDLNVLDDDEALKLFVKVVGEERAAAEPEATAELLDACAGLPLAIRICAARLATRSGWTIRAMASRLRDEHSRLDEMRAGDLAVRASFEVSFTSLPASTDKQGIDPACTFCLLGLWQGSSISSAAAAALFGVPEYAAEDSARRAGNRRGEAWILNSLGYALGITGDSSGIGCLEQALEIRRETGDRMGEAQAANNLADAYQRLGRTEEALGVLHRALDLNREVGYRFGEGIALVNLGDVLLDLNRPDEAIGYLQRALRTFTEINHADGTGYAFHWLGRCHASVGRDAEALECLWQALASHQTAGNRHRQAVTLRFIGRTQAGHGLTAEAHESWAQSAAIFDDLGDRTQAAEVRAEMSSGI